MEQGLSKSRSHTSFESIFTPSHLKQVGKLQKQQQQKSYLENPNLAQCTKYYDYWMLRCVCINGDAE